MKTVIFPYGRDDVQLVRYSTWLGAVGEIAPVSMPGYAVGGLDSTAIDGGRPNGIAISEDFGKAMEGATAVILTGTPAGCGYVETIKREVRRGTRVAVLDEALCDELNAELEFAASRDTLWWSPKLESKRAAQRHGNDLLKPTGLALISVPVVLVCSEGPSCRKFEMQLSVVEHLRKLSYRVSMIGSRHYSPFLGAPAFPLPDAAFGQGPGVRIRMLNHLAKHLEVTFSPDVIIVGVPGGFVPITDEVDGGYGLTVEEACCALNPDLAIVAVYFADEITRDSVDAFATGFERRFRLEVLRVVIANSWIDLGQPTSSEDLRVTYLPNATVARLAKRYHDYGRVTVACDGRSGEELARCIVNRLSSSHSQKKGR